jgi:hypothetical protein
MFFNAEDIRWFKPVELWTKQGMRGHIREPRGACENVVVPQNWGLTTTTSSAAAQEPRAT